MPYHRFLPLPSPYLVAAVLIHFITVSASPTRANRRSLSNPPSRLQRSNLALRSTSADETDTSVPSTSDTTTSDSPIVSVLATDSNMELEHIIPDVQEPGAGEDTSGGGPTNKVLIILVSIFSVIIGLAVIWGLYILIRKYAPRLRTKLHPSSQQHRHQPQHQPTNRPSPARRSNRSHARSYSSPGSQTTSPSPPEKPHHHGDDPHEVHRPGATSFSRAVSTADSARESEGTTSRDSVSLGGCEKEV
ncbi:hypothetical protein BDZ91DRAFT_461603 [Kalaharituber pfeilii]|nr:hypothetical protein BDZ91DRAFT_461603 [Kalaharituber pfeilii]